MWAHLTFTVCVCASADSWVSECDETLEEDLLCNTLLISGPTGVGKTAAVYACAQELGFKVSAISM